MPSASPALLLSKAPPVDDPSGPVFFTYTATGKRATMSDATGLTRYVYDNLDRLYQKLTPLGTLTYSYDENGNVMHIASSNPNGTDVVYDWDEINRLKAVHSDPADRSSKTSYGYDTS